MKVAAIQCALTDNSEKNIQIISQRVEEAVEQNAQVILPSELFAGHYFCKEEKEEFFARAEEWQKSRVVAEMKKLAAKWKVAIPVSIFEKEGPHFYNSVVMLDAGGEVLGLYRKSHIPDGPGYEEKFYFRPGNTGFKVFQTQFGKVGVGICWDQWFPECARALMLLGAEVLFYPTAIGSEPDASHLSTKNLWQRAMLGHAVSNVVPVVAANRTGTEGPQSFYGHSFICDHRGEILAEISDKKEGVICATFDLKEVEKNRAAFGFFRDRRPDLYRDLLVL